MNSCTHVDQITQGATVSITGYSHQALTGQTVVDVQIINGQTIAPVPPAGPPALAGPGPRR